MIKKLICLLWGHKTVVKKSTGQQFDTHHRLYPEVKIKGMYYVWDRQNFCLRCGKTIKHDN